jgi:hypothetical protein
MVAKTTAERQREFRARRSADSIIEVRGLFAHVDDHAQMKAHAAKLAKKRERADRRKPCSLSNDTDV